MRVVITYGTYDLLHYGHIKLLERAKALGDYLIVGVTSDLFDKQRGKINVTQDVLTRVENVKKTGLADKIIIEEYDGQKIDDIKKYNVDIFTVGSDWMGKFDYLNEYCNVVYLDRTMGISSSDIRSNNGNIRLGIIGESTLSYKFINEVKYVNGIEVSGIFSEYNYSNYNDALGLKKDNIDDLLNDCDAVYVVSEPSKHYEHVKLALEAGKHVLCEAPIAQTHEEAKKLIELAKQKHLIVMDSIKTAFSMAYQRMILLLKGGAIGDIVSVDAVCTSLKNYENNKETLKRYWGSYYAWGPTAVLPIFQLLGTNYDDINICTKMLNEEMNFDSFTKISFDYPNAVASLKVGNGVKSEGELIVTGTKGYAYIPSPWWKNDYFELRFENQNDNKKFFYKIDGEGIRFELVTFKNIINNVVTDKYISDDISMKIVEISEMILLKKYKAI